MTKEDILRLRDTAEQTRVQFKERVTRENKYDVSSEMVAGSCITRALKFTPDIKFVNDETLNEFVVMVERKNVEDNVEVGDRDNDRVDDRDNILESNNLKEQTSTPNDRDDRVKNVEDDVEDGNEVNQQQRRTPYRLLSGIQKDIIQYCSVARTYREILEHIGYKYNSKYMVSHIKPLIEMGYLELTIPDKPNSKNQKYRKAK